MVADGRFDVGELLDEGFIYNEFFVLLDVLVADGGLFFHKFIIIYQCFF